MKNGNGHIGSHRLDTPHHIGVQRGLAEFRAGRPVLLAAGAEIAMALPADGADAHRLAEFRAACAPAAPRLAVTARRAKALGLAAAGPLLLPLAPDDDADSILALAIEAGVARRIAGVAAGTAATAALELAKLAQRIPALLVADAAAALGAADPPLIRVEAAAVMRFRRDLVRSLAIAGEAQVPLQDGIATRFVVFRDGIGGSSTAIVVGKPDLARPVPVRLHSACLTGDVFGSRRCDCGDQLRLALSRLQIAGGGIILYLEQEGRGLGLANKMRAYRLQEAGLDTVDANTTLGFDDDERDYGIAARMLDMLGCKRVLLLTNNPGKLDGLAEAGVEIAGRMSLYTPMNSDNRRYMTAKAKRAGHWLDGVMLPSGHDEDQRPRPSRTPPV